MKVLNFSVVEILPSLLDKSKQQTIRPAWKEEIDVIAGIECKIIFKKPPRFKVGEKVTIMWKQRSKYETFCNKCGNGLWYESQHYKDKRETNQIIQEEHFNKGCKSIKGFNKILGTVEITEVFKIEMDINWINKKEWEVPILKNSYICKIYAIADGFKSAEEMFKVLDRMYDLSSPKEFYVYRWRWLE